MVAAVLVILVGSTPARGTLAAAPPDPASPPSSPPPAIAVTVVADAAAGTAIDPAAGGPMDDAPPFDAPPFDAPPIGLPPTSPEPSAALVSAPPTSTLRAARTTARKKRPVPTVRAAARPAAMWAQLRRGFAVTGLATWYGSTRGYADVAHVAMAGARFLPAGRAAPRVRVCVAGRCLVLPVVDACACRSTTSVPRIVDLSAAAVRRLGLDPSRGVYEVRITLVAG